MPTFEKRERFLKDYSDLSDQHKVRFMVAVRDFVADLKTGAFRPGLRVKGVEGMAGVYEMTWAPDGRATWEYGTPQRPDEPHIVWRRCGSHDVFRSP